MPVTFVGSELSLPLGLMMILVPAVPAEMDRHDDQETIYLYICFCALLISSISFGITNDTVYLEGTVKSFTDLTIKVESSGSIWAVPRKMVNFPDLTVDGPIKVAMTKTELAKLKREPVKKK